MRKKVFVGISGGVDSAVASYMLLELGYNVVGVFMKNWSGRDYGLEDNCPWKDDLQSARAVANHLGIELKVYNFEKEYRELVIKDFFYQYSIGNTPNPDILCNKYIKFDKFQQRAVANGADFIATGHYARTDGKSLLRPKDVGKDQTYFLHQLTQEQISRTLFPLADYDKTEVRRIAKMINLPNYDRKDSQGICFIGKVDTQDFLSQELALKEGEIIDIDSGKTVGTHNGVWFYTIGQRQGLNIGGQEKPYFVADKDVQKNVLYAAQGKQNPKLWKKQFIINHFHRINKDNLSSGNYQGVVRYRSEPQRVSLHQDDSGLGNVTVTFEKPQWAPSLGQSIVIYNSNICIGGGAITKIVE